MLRPKDLFEIFSIVRLVVFSVSVAIPNVIDVDPRNFLTKKFLINGVVSKKSGVS